MEALDKIAFNLVEMHAGTLKEIRLIRQCLGVAANNQILVGYTKDYHFQGGTDLLKRVENSPNRWTLSDRAVKILRVNETFKKYNFIVLSEF